MTRLNSHKMGCGQSVRKKTKHKVDRSGSDHTNGGHDNQGSQSVPSGAATASHRGSGSDPLTPSNTEELDDLLSKHSSGQPPGVTRGQANGEPRSDPYQEQMDKPAARNIQQKGPLHPEVKISTSQAEFFKMLEDKIEGGPDYVSQQSS